MEVDKFSLATLPEVPLGVVPCRERKSLLVTGPGEIRLFDVFDQICAVSWHLPLHFGLSAPAVQSFTSGQFFGVKENDNLLSWCATDADVKSWKQRKVPRPVHRLLTHESLAGHLISVFTDGTLVAVSESLELISFSADLPHPKAPSRVLFCDLAKASAERLFCFTLILNDNKYYFGVHEVLSGAPLSLKLLKYHHLEAHEKHTVATSAFDPFTRMLSLLWSDMRWEVFNFPTLEELCSGSYASAGVRQLLARSSGASESTPKRKRKDLKPEGAGLPLACLVFKASIVAVAAVFGSSVQLIFWDVKYGAVVASVELLDLTAAGSAPPSRLQLVCSGDHRYVAVAVDAQVIVCPTYCPTASLALSLGRLPESSKFVSRSEEAPPPPPSSTDAAPQLASVSLGSLLPQLRGKKKRRAMAVIGDDAWEREVASGVQGAAGVLAQLGDPKQTKDEAAFASCLQTHLSSLPKGSAVSQQFAAAVARLALPHGFWSPIVLLLKSRSLSVLALPELLPAMLAAKNLGALRQLLKTADDIPEASLVRILQFIVSETPRADLVQLLQRPAKPDTSSKKDKKQSKKQTAMSATSEKQSGRALEYFINLLLVQPHNAIFMQQFVKDLSADEIQAVLSCLVEWLQRYTEKLAVAPPTLSLKDYGAVPSLAQVVGWLSLLVDSHLTQLILMDQWQPQLLTAKRLLNAQVELCDVTQPLTGALAHLVQAGKLPLQETAAYSIELLRLP
jgi:hypothetical protein